MKTQDVYQMKAFKATGALVKNNLLTIHIMQLLPKLSKISNIMQLLPVHWVSLYTNYYFCKNIIFFYFP